MNGAIQTLPTSLYFPALIIAVSLLGSAVLIIGFFVRYWMVTQEKKDQAQDDAIKSIQTDFSDFKAVLPRTYVLREDFLRAVASLDNKVDVMMKEIGEMSKLLNQLIGGK